ncbi:MAG: UDP-glucose/GDP-mannose dehydrogenase family protein [Gemmatimonadales bacterium]|nr:UDP-glucose/GDP-mannose dehydrogenase family protein [Gemmatimonadales bacterium]
MRIAVLGTGYVGLVTGACFAERGHSVICVDMDQGKVDRINRGELPIYEPGLDDLLQRNVPGRLQATTDLAAAVRDSELSLIAVGTPFDGESIDLSQIRDVSLQVGRALTWKSEYHTVIVKSTVVPGTTDDVVRPILEEASGKRAGSDFGLGMNPEFLREGEAVGDFMKPDRIVMGGIDERTHLAQEELYAAFEDVDRVRTTNRTAEMIKYASNSVLATMISFSNEIANLCSTLGDIDVVEVMRGVHLDRRLSPILPNGRRLKPGFTTYLEAGCGFGGSCFPKDVRALVAQGRDAGVPMRVLEAVMNVNHSQPLEIVKLLARHFDSLKGVKVTILGLAFKPGTDDMRESPAIPVVNTLRSLGAQLTLHDPVAVEEARKVFGADGLSYSTDLAAAIDGSAAIVLLTRWPEYMSVPELAQQAIEKPLVVDGRRLLAQDAVERYEGIGLRRTDARSFESVVG